MPFALRFSTEAKGILEDLESNPAFAGKNRKVRKALALLSANPRYPGLRSHAFVRLLGPAGEQVSESYVENQTPGAWRIWWWDGPERDMVTILSIGPHPA